MRGWYLTPLAFLVAGCGTEWTATYDADGDGWTVAQGDCDDNPETGAAIHPGAEDTGYDGVDADCAGDNDNDLDKDGHDAVEAGGDDCWDDPDAIPADFVALNGLPQVAAADVYPGAADVVYDGIDADCAADTDFDNDGDGFDTATWAQRDASVGDDCFDDVSDDFTVADTCSGAGELPDPAEVFPGAQDEWYDGVDQNCDAADDFDSDGDTYAWCEECDDTDGAVYPNPDVEEIWYNGEDENCDGNDADQDGDGYAVADYPYSLDRNGDDVADFISGDCWDDPTAIATDFDAINGFAQPEAWEVHPDAIETYYDGVDADCDTATDDFDADADAQRTDLWADRDGAFGADCDDDDGSVYYGATETWYDGIDGDCDDQSDYDQDYDGDDAEAYGGGDCNDSRPTQNSLVEYEDCGTTYDDDCDGDTNDPDDIASTDADSEIYYFDGDNDGYGLSTSYHRQCQADSTTQFDVTVSTDCDDADSGDYPGATETIGNQDDESCDGAEICYDDDDNDGYLDTTADTRLSSNVACTDANEGTNTDPTTDCDDADSGDYPGATEIVGNGDDESCDGAEICYDDDDNDAFLDTTADTRSSTDADCADANEGTNTDLTTDCDDADSGDYPGATETIGNQDDESCDGTEICYDDDDNDGFLDTTGDTRLSSDTDCTDTSEGTNSDLTTDCDDASATDYPGATETVGNGDDESCDGTEICYDDDDNDGYLDTAGDTRTSSDTDCADANEGTNTDLTTDCDDADSGDYPGATETVGNQDDESCDGTEICYHDDDNDTYLDTTGDTIASTDTDCTDANEGTNTDLTTDCDDADSGDYPGATETVGNGDDESCDGTEICYDDDDNDGYLDTAGDTRTSSDTDCADANEGTNTDLTTDCDDADSGDYPGATETVGNGDDESCDGTEVCFDDDDNDGFLDTSADTRSSSDTDCSDANEGTNTDLTTDCDDTSATDYPGATEIVGNGDDEDCNNAEICYHDDDNDTYLDTTGDTVASTDTDCADANEGTNTDLTTDCDDADSGDYPGATETVGNGDDESCDGTEVCFDDDDNDGFLDTSADTRSSSDTDCSDANEGTNTDLTTDCDDADATEYPGATEIVGNSEDDDCNNAEICYHDDDNDTYLDTSGDTVASTDTDCGDANEGTSTDLTTDCDDASATDYPGATETVGNGDDESCDGTEICFDDDDNDGFLDTSADTRSSADTDCSDANEGTNSDLTTDCDDTDALAYPGAPELCDGQQNNCSVSWTNDNNRVHHLTGSTYTAVTVSTTATTTTSLTASAGAYTFCDGTYYAAIDIASAGTYSFESYSGDAVTTLDAGTTGTTSVFAIRNASANVTIGDAAGGNGFTVSGGFGRAVSTDTYGGNIYQSAGTTAVYGSSITDGAADFGGGIAVTGGSFTIQDSTVDGNVAATDGGGFYLSGASSTLALVDVIVTANNGSASSGRGGGAHIATGAMTCSGSSSAADLGFTDNDAKYGGGVFLVAGTGTFTTTNCDFGTGGSDNTATQAFDVGVGGTSSVPTFAYDAYGNDVSVTCTSTGCL